jgi:PAS domain-containing protein
MKKRDTFPAAQDASRSICKYKSDAEFRSPVDSDSLSVSGSELSCSIPIDDRKERHKIIERNRRDKTRLLIEQLQALLPNAPDHEHNPNVNHVLQQTLDFLLLTENQSGGEAHESTADEMKIHLADIMTNRIDDMTSRKYFFTFDNAPFGIVISRANGALLRANLFFCNLICAPHESLEGQTIFSLTSNHDLAVTMQARKPTRRLSSPSPCLSSSKA